MVDYHIISQQHRVDAWTGWHLPFRHNEGKRHRLHDCPYCGYRVGLCGAIQKLLAQGNISSLLAMYTYRASGRRQADLDNLLFFNVDPTFKVFGTAIRFLRFERVDSPVPMPPTPLRFTPLVHVRYEVGQESPVFRNGRTLAQSDSVSCDRTDLNDTARLWRLLKHSISPADGTQPLVKFKVQLMISANYPLNIVKTSDTLIDGFISALHHRSEGDNDLDEVVEAIRKNYPWDRNEIRSLLLKQGVLGHCLVPRRNIAKNACSIKWHPHDDLIVACEVIRADADNLSIRGRILTG
jgi:hypothetical protein